MLITITVWTSQVAVFCGSSDVNRVTKLFFKDSKIIMIWHEPRTLNPLAVEPRTLNPLCHRKMSRKDLYSTIYCITASRGVTSSLGL